MPPRPRRRKKESADVPLRRPSAAPPATDPTALTARLRHLHERAEDPSVDRMPPPEEVWGVLLYCEQRASALRRSPQDAMEAALLCVQLWEYVAYQREVREGRAAQRALDAGATLKSLTGPMRVRGESGAYQKMRRFRAAELSLRPEIGPVRRSPEAVARIEREMAEEERKRRLQRFAAEDQGERWSEQARSLVDVGGGIPRDAEGLVEFWLDQLEYDLEEGGGSGALAHDVQSLLRAVEIAGKRCEGEGDLDDDVRAVLAQVREFVTAQAQG